MTDTTEHARRVHSQQSPEGVVVAEVDGAVDAASHQEVANALTALVESRPAALVLDLRRVEFLASIGIAVLVNAQHTARRCGVAFEVVADNRSVLRPLVAAGVDRLLTVRPTMADALAAVWLSQA